MKLLTAVKQPRKIRKQLFVHHITPDKIIIGADCEVGEFDLLARTVLHIVIKQFVLFPDIISAEQYLQ
jgi:hypothetical protein